MTDNLTSVVHQSVPILGQMGIEVLEAEPGRAVALLPLDPNRNHVGTTYAGSLFSAAEVLGGVLAMTSFSLDGYVPLIRSMSINYLKAATGDVRARAEMTLEEIERVTAEALANGKANYELTAVVTDESGVTVATTVGHYQLRNFASAT